ncbi:polyphosphate polymerase domain-containing protein [Abyssisolibacter fermentans]|uniref:polyphosphate polymerase domain-containing protein n=1 Tax=Abyssisolibacter fermentans TaxID=1766203 RepID=UPI0008379DE3|nr:polyphosphate polymerase domain-containing protein [Abyssisolibacter fermentans]
MMKNDKQIYNRVYRNEIKFYIDNHGYMHLSKLLSKTLSLDKNSGSNNEYWIRSLYFDSMYDRDYFDKVVGSQNRKKIRLRIYDIAQEKVKLEIKNKFDQYMLKESVTIGRQDAIDLIKGNKEVLLKYNNKTANRVYYFMNKEFYQPKVIVDYKREAYTCPVQDIRITFDKDIRTTITDFNIFDDKLNTIPIFKQHTMVMEVKYNRFLPDWIKDMLSNINGDKCAISKYCLSRNIF